MIADGTYRGLWNGRVITLLAPHAVHAFVPEEHRHLLPEADEVASRIEFEVVDGEVELESVRELEAVR